MRYNYPVDWIKNVRLHWNKVKNHDIFVLYIHGYSGTWDEFNEVSKDLEKLNIAYCAIEWPDDLSYDFWKIKNMKFNEIKKIIIDVINYNELENIILVGHSLGGGLAASICKEVEDKINTLILIDPLCVSIYEAASYISNLGKKVYTDIWVKQIMKFAHDMQNDKVSRLKASFANMVLNKVLTRRSIMEKIIKVISESDNEEVIRWRKTIFKSFGYENITVDNFPEGYLKLGFCLLDPYTLWDIESSISKVKKDFFLYFGENDVIINAKKAVPRLINLNSNVKTRIIKNSGHSPYWEDYEKFKKCFIPDIQNIYKKWLKEKLNNVK